MIDIERLDKLQQRARTIALLALIVFLALLAVSLWSLWSVRGEIHSLEARKEELTTQIKQAEQEVQKLEEQRQVLSKTISEIAVRDPEPVKQAINAATATQLKAPQNEQERKQQEYGQQAIRELTLNPPRPAESLKRIYLHISNEKQRARASQIAEQLKKAGYIVPSIEHVRDGAPPVTQLRCSWRDDTERADAIHIISLLQQWDVRTEPRPVKVDARPWQYEIWFGTEGINATSAY